jgi:hypothetical protein
MVEAQELHPTRILAFCVMRSHWHFVVWPRKEGELTAHFRWLAHGCHGQLAARARRCYSPVLCWQSWDCNRQALHYRQCQIFVPALESIEPAISDFTAWNLGLGATGSKLLGTRAACPTDTKRTLA